jgi:hypothetical protein
MQSISRLQGAAGSVNFNPAAGRATSGNAAIESHFSLLETERIARKTYRSRNQARADVFDYIEPFYNPTRRHSPLGYLNPMDFEKQAHVARPKVRETGGSSFPPQSRRPPLAAFANDARIA